MPASSATASVARPLRSVADPTRLRLRAQHALATTAVYAVAFDAGASGPGLRVDRGPCWASSGRIELGRRPDHQWCLRRLCTRRPALRPSMGRVPAAGANQLPAIGKTAATLAAAAALFPLLKATLVAAASAPGRNHAHAVCRRRRRRLAEARSGSLIQTSGCRPIDVFFWPMPRRCRRELPPDTSSALTAGRESPG